MKHFTIDTENAITVHATKKAAKETGAAVFSTEEQLADAVGPDNKRLVEIWNSLPGVKPVTKFTSRKIATERIWKAIQGLGQAADAPAPVQPEAFGSCIAAVEAVAVPETPFDEPKPDPAVTEHPAPTEIAPQVEEQPAAPPVQPVEPLATVSAQAPDVAPSAPKTTKKTTRQKKAPKPAPEAKEAKPKEARADSKGATILALIKRPDGASLADLMAATSWQKHSIRGFLSTLGKKMGRPVDSVKAENGERRYSIAADAATRG